MKRVIEPEILDDLPASDPRAQRSRRDLRLINALMGNERWILRELRRRARGQAVCELGAGDGELLRALARQGHPGCGFDFQPAPADLAPGAEWQQGDFLQTLPRQDQPARVVVGSLILHHLSSPQLAELGRLLSRSRLLLFAEPLRSPWALVEGRTLFPFVNDVTRHDMMVSIRAGFRRGELRELLALEGDWQWRERTTLRGGLRSLAWREEAN
ncbi:class I SAM-dependent methyltransferase [Roseibacillus ishigakijimensis]|uniref:Methyltransferase domain-containing protein n=1 Tax=Roseibacillus ishigakijimensis TaxID=454146 RepID=A0A934VM76_9BACT|nr:class I SAM-dependent methyltransferase [Roseibacillus ishigakijimensis]MBK1833987.1 methyltransferase domain-containing protein [Roseibacillus ishigakijimensis]